MNDKYNHKSAILSLLDSAIDPIAQKRVSVRKKTVIITGMPFVGGDQLAEDYKTCAPYCLEKNLDLLLFCGGSELACRLNQVSRSTPVNAIKIGTMSEWQIESWIEPVHKSIRLQIDRTKKAGVVIERLDPNSIDSSMSRSIQELMRLQIARSRLPPLGYVAKRPTIDQLGSYDRVYVAKDATDQIIALACVRYLHERRCLYLEHLFRSDYTPNGMTEFLLHEVACNVDASPHIEVDRICLGLSPLADVHSPLLRTCAQLSSWLYSFNGIQKFRQRLHPDNNLPMYLFYPDYLTLPEALYRLLAAFIDRFREY